MEILRNLLQQIRCRLQVINHENSLILTEVHGPPLRMKFSLRVYKDYTITCFNPLVPDLHEKVTRLKAAGLFNYV